MTKRVPSATVLLLVLILILIGMKTRAAVVFTKAGSPHYITEDFIISNHDTIIIDAGATLVFSPEVNLITNGVIMINGTADEPVSLLPAVEGTGWGQIQINRPNRTSYIRYTNIVDGTIFSQSCNMVLDHATFINNQNISWMVPIMFVRDASVDIRNSSIYGSEHGEGFQMLNSETVAVKDCYFSRIGDAVELTNVNGGHIGHNVFENTPDDAIDLNNCSNTLIDSNLIVNARDRGMELGSENNGNSENITVRRNVVIGCKEGIIFKENSYGQAINNTFYANNTGISCIENNGGKRGSSVQIQNCVFSASVENDVFVDANSTLITDYCLSDSGPLAGSHNLFDDPLFVDPSAYDFHLQKDSPCINAGNPDLPWDPDHTVSDLGAFFFNTDTTGSSVPDYIFKSISLFPNPFSQVITLQWPTTSSREITIELFDLHGVNIPATITRTQSGLLRSYQIVPQNRIMPKTTIICRITIGNKTQSRLLIHR